MSTGWSSTTTKNVRFCSHTMKRYLPCAILPTRNLASEMLPSRSEQGQHPVSSHSLTTRRWRQHPKRKRKERHRIQSSILHTREVGSEHEHEHTSTSEDDLLKLLGVTGDTQTWARFDKKATTSRSTSSSGPFWNNVTARLTTHHKTGRTGTCPLFVTYVRCHFIAHL